MHHRTRRADTATAASRNWHGARTSGSRVAAYDHPETCYDREYLFQFSEMDPNIHQQALEQVTAAGAARPDPSGCVPAGATEPYIPAYFMINGRSMPDDMDPNYALQYPHQPYNGNPHMHPGELVLLRIIGRDAGSIRSTSTATTCACSARDGNLLLSHAIRNKLAGPLLFTTTTTPGQTMDGIFQWTGKGLNWDVYGHTPAPGPRQLEPSLYPGCERLLHTGSAPTAINYYEWCADHKKPLESKPFGDRSAAVVR